MTSEALTYWLAGTIPAAATWALNVTLRGQPALNSSPADWALMLLAFDGAIAIGIQDLACYVPNAAIRQLLPAITPALIFLSFLNWLLIVRWIEPTFLVPPEHRPSLGVRVAIAMSMWAFVGSNIYFHYYLLGRGFNVV
ncbi:hypothetical protein [Mitsuaria sp. 7]|uniref:hypothetical protein n=1 Tax=Mitsuaria sp. 7 TaxID=1658665 RepID=UPI0007DCFBC0|nr:hypothetical protein [Mitsuaria sp. 7]ANH67351.1 hypothetical protein ABE85_06795 [Mitsuaria sp. 7]